MSPASRRVAGQRAADSGGVAWESATTFEAAIIRSMAREMGAAITILVSAAAAAVASASAVSGILHTARLTPVRLSLLPLVGRIPGTWPSGDWDPMGAIGAVQGFVGATMIAAILARATTAENAADAARLTMLDALARVTARFGYLAAAAIALCAATSGTRAVFLGTVAVAVFTANCFLIAILGRRPWRTARSLRGARRTLATYRAALDVLDVPSRSPQVGLRAALALTLLTPGAILGATGRVVPADPVYAGFITVVLVGMSLISPNITASTRIAALLGERVRRMVNRGLLVTMDVLTSLATVVCVVTDPRSAAMVVPAYAAMAAWRWHDRRPATTDALARSELGRWIRGAEDQCRALTRDLGAHAPTRR